VAFGIVGFLYKDRTMSEPLAPRLLDRDMIDQAYPLIRNIASGITLDRWGRFAKPLVASRSASWPRGLMTIQNTAGYILGLFGFEVRDGLHVNRTLWIENIIIANIPGRDAIWTTVIETVDQLADLHGCQAIRASLSDDLDPDNSDRNWLSSSFESAGYSLEGIRACKRIEMIDRVHAQ
jgi:hypothetical protein